jgi:hypothetical protein
MHLDKNVTISCKEDEDWKLNQLLAGALLPDKSRYFKAVYRYLTMLSQLQVSKGGTVPPLVQWGLNLPVYFP